MDYEPDYTLDMTIHEIRILHKCIEVAIERWTGGDPEEQEELFRARDQFQAIILDYTFHNL